MKAAHDPGTLIPDVGVAFRQHAKHLAVTDRADLVQPGRAQRRDRDRQRIVRVGLRRLARTQHPGPRRERGGHIHDVFAGRDKLLSEQVAHPVRSFDRPQSRPIRLGPPEQLLDLAP